MGKLPFCNVPVIRSLAAFTVFQTWDAGGMGLPGRAVEVLEANERVLIHTKIYWSVLECLVFLGALECFGVVYNLECFVLFWRFRVVLRCKKPQKAL